MQFISSFSSNLVRHKFYAGVAWLSSVRVVRRNIKLFNGRNPLNYDLIIV